jgi:endonuclease/exonuclease/phosphatase family metal-dependent hydrolase
MTTAIPVLAFASINIERSKHLSRVATFLRAHAPDVVCLQELVANDLAALRDELGYKHHFYVPMCRFPDPSGPRTIGIGVFSHHAFLSAEGISYGGKGSGLDVVDRTSAESRFQTNRYSIALVRIGLGDDVFTIGTTHFPWTDNANTTDFQRTACDNLLRMLEGRSLVFAGDFNAPRDGEIFNRLAKVWTDNIPPAYTSSLDRTLHRVGHRELMVDGLFSTAEYSVSEVALHEGVSDHRAVTALVGKQV